VLNIQTGGTTAITVDASQRVGIGTASPATKLNISSAGADVEVRASTTTSGNVRFGFDADGAYYNWIQTNRSSGAIQFAISNSEVMQINAVGGLKVINTIGVGNATPSTSGAGITFPATQSASSDANTLDDYEEGTWTPNLTGDVGGSGQTYTAQTGTYTKVGRAVTVGFYIQLSAKGTITGNAIISNLPFSVLNSGSIVYGGALAYWLALAVNHNVIGIYTNTNTTNIYFWGSTGTASTPPLLTTTDIANNTRFWGSVTYMTA